MKALLIFLALMILAGGTLVYHVRKQGRESRYEAFVLQGYRTAVETNHEAIVRSSTACQRIAENAERLLPSLSNLVVETLRIEALPIPGAVVAKAPASAPHSEAESPAGRESPDQPIGIMGRAEIDRRRLREQQAGQPAVAERAEAPAMPAPTVPEGRRMQPPEDEDKPEGILSLRELEARRARGDRDPPPPVEVKPAARSAPAVSPPPVRTVAPAAGVPSRKEERPIQVLARQVEGHIAKARENAQATMALELDARGLRDEVMTVRTSTSAAERVVAIIPLTEKAYVLEAECNTELDLARKAMPPVEKEKKRVEDDYRAKVEEARRRKEEADRKALIASEIAAAEELKKALAPMIRQYQFAEGLTRATMAMDQCATEEGKEAHRPLVVRCMRLKVFKEFMIARIKAKPYRWGWGDPGSARDILSADENGVKHTTATVAWPEIGVKQLSRIVDYCLADTSLGVKAQGEYHFGAAILFKDLGVEDIAGVHKKKAIFAAPYMEEEVIRLLQ